MCCVRVSLAWGERFDGEQIDARLSSDEQVRDRVHVLAPPALLGIGVEASDRLGIRVEA